jgi:hypothetical protein
MFNISNDLPEEPHWHPHPGDAMEDPWEIPGLMLCALGIGALAMTLTAAASGFAGRAAAAAIAAAALFVIGMVLVRFEYVREWRAERRKGRHGHNPLVKGKWHGSAI